MNTATEVREPDVREQVRVWRAPQVPPSSRQAPAEPLFAEVLPEAGGLQRRRRTLATVLSIALQCSVVGGLLIAPLMYTESLPRQQLLSFLVASPPPPPALSSGRVIGGVPGGIPGGPLGGVIGGIISATPTPSFVPKLAVSAAPKRIRISQGVTRGSLIQKIEPAYPPMARSARIQGQVVLAAIISKTGEIQNLVLVSGHPMLVPAAIQAVKQWCYRPFLLDGEPVEVETTITLTFQLSSG